MRKYIFAWVLVIPANCLFAQDNNPYDQRGVDYVSSVALIRDDFSSGKAIDFSEATLNYYSAQVPLKNRVSVEMAASIVNTMKSPDFNYESLMDRSSLSGFSKTVLTDIIRNVNQLDDNGYRANLVVKTNEVLSADMPEAEKEIVLSLIAVGYHMADPVTPEAMANGREHGCWLSGPYGSGPASQAQCIAAGAIVGGIIGHSICGIFCMLGGAIVGGVLGAVS